MTAAFSRDLVFEVHPACAGLDEIGATVLSDVERASPAGIRIDEQGQVRSRGNAAHVLAHIVERRHPEINGEAEGVRGYAEKHPTDSMARNPLRSASSAEYALMVPTTWRGRSASTAALSRAPAEFKVVVRFHAAAIGRSVEQGIKKIH